MKDDVMESETTRILLLVQRWATWREGQCDWPEGASTEELALHQTVQEGRKTL